MKLNNGLLKDVHIASGKKVGLNTYLQLTGKQGLDILNELAIVFWTYDVKTKTYTYTGGLENVFGYSLEEFVKLKLDKKIFDNKNRKIGEQLNYIYKRGKSFELEFEVIKKNGSKGWVEIKAKPLYNSMKRIIAFEGCTIEISDKKLSKLESKESEIKYQTLVDNYALGVYITQNGKYVYVNERMSQLTDYSQEELNGMEFKNILDNESKQKVTVRELNFRKGINNEIDEINIIQKNGSIISLEINSTKIMYQNKPAYMGTLFDVTEQKKNREMVHYLAYYDTLTGIPNRNLFYKTMKKELVEARREKGKLSVLFLDLDNFKAINDTFGHQTGDKVIKKAAEKMKEMVEGKGFIARIGGDEFVILMKYQELEDVKKFAESIIKEVPNSLNSKITTTPTIGISLYPEHGNRVECLLRCADIAMYNSKQNENRSSNYRIYDNSMYRDTVRTNELIGDIKKGLEQEQFYLVYQPKVVLKMNKVIGVEALVRWNHPQFGEVLPNEFIPLAEKNGKINNIGDWVLEKAISDVKKFKQDMNLNVNISSGQLLKENFVENIKYVLSKYNFPSQLLNLEITESVALIDIEKTFLVLKQLRELGVKISLDDFGTGYSSLSYLTKFPVDFLKIDRSFVTDLEKDPTKKTILQAIINIAHGLNMKVVAEGIETKEQKDLLVSYNCDKGQGYYFSKPLTFELINKFLLEHK